MLTTFDFHYDYNRLCVVPPNKQVAHSCNLQFGHGVGGDCESLE